MTRGSVMKATARRGFDAFLARRGRSDRKSSILKPLLLQERSSLMRSSVNKLLRRPRLENDAG